MRVGLVPVRLVDVAGGNCHHTVYGVGLVGQHGPCWDVCLCVGLNNLEYLRHTPPPRLAVELSSHLEAVPSERQVTAKADDGIVADNQKVLLCLLVEVHHLQHRLGLAEHEVLDGRSVDMNGRHRQPYGESIAAHDAQLVHILAITLCHIFPFFNCYNCTSSAACTASKGS